MRLAKHVTPEVTEARLARQWAEIAAKQGQERPRGRWRFLAWAGAVGVVGALALFVSVQRTRVATQTVPASIEATAAGHAHASIAAGCEVDLMPGARIVVEHADPHEVAVLLQRGAADFDVSHDPQRVFRVRAGSVEIVDLGTRFHVDRSATDDVTVSVQEGAVRVERDGRAATELHAGETWAQSASLESSGDGGATALATAAVERPALEAGVKVVVSPDPDAEALVKFVSMCAEHREREAYDSVGPERFARLVARANAKELMQLGDAARLTGHPQDSAVAYDALRTHRRSDARAGLAAFELGRLRLDKLDDAAGAEEAFRDAIVLAPDAPFREDCEARRVDALERIHDADGCARARADYLARYPGGLYVSQVSKRCTW